MADQLTLFRYFYRPSAIHRLEARCKLLCVAVFAASVIAVSGRQGSFWGLAAFSILLWLVWYASGLPLRVFARQSRILLIWLPVAALVPAFTMPGQALHGAGIGQWLSLEGTLYGIDFAWKFALFFCLSILFTATTTAAQISRAVAALLRVFPKRISATASAMMGLIFAQTPAFFAAYHQIRQAQIARLAHGKGWKGRVKRGKQLLLPLLRLVFTRSDELVFAMEARCFNYNRTLLRTAIKLPDVVLTALFCCCCAVSVCLNYQKTV